MFNRNNIILIVEDSDEDFETTTRAFRKSGLANGIRRCEDGDDALDYLHKRGKYENDPTYLDPNLVLLDLNLPGTDGREVLKEMRQTPGLCKLPVIVLTTSNDPHDINACYEDGANSYIQKPVDFEGYLKAIRELRKYWFEIVILPTEENS